ncbi:MAG: SagB/ThcOx family dehydrogenase [Acidobacteria bacterium]|nr:MAG: SagB/ThcOx family dehydrogenase [Acidobacteriota bacterium]
MAEGLKLPPPRSKGDLSLEEVLAKRRSIRDFRDRALTDEELSQLLWAAQGITDQEGDRTAPSAGALFPLELYVARSDGLFHYQPADHSLRCLATEDLRSRICRAALDQEMLEHAPATFVLAAVYERTARKYGRSRSPRYVHMEAGHAAQNLLLEAVALGLGAVLVGAFEDEEIRNVLSLERDHRPLYLIPVGPVRRGIPDG